MSNIIEKMRPKQVEQSTFNFCPPFIDAVVHSLSADLPDILFGKLNHNESHYFWLGLEIAGMEKIDLRDNKHRLNIIISRKINVNSSLI